jgi:hypothetical protein
MDLSGGVLPRASNQSLQKFLQVTSLTQPDRDTVVSHIRWIQG